MASRVIVIVILSVVLLLVGIAVIDAVTDGGANRAVIIDGRVCVQGVDPWGNVEEVECADG